MFDRINRIIRIFFHYFPEESNEIESTFFRKPENYRNPLYPVNPVQKSKYKIRIHSSIRFQMTFNSFPTLINLSRAKSRSSLEWAADIWTRMRACPLGTTG